MASDGGISCHAITWHQAGLIEARADLPSSALPRGHDRPIRFTDRRIAADLTDGFVCCPHTCSVDVSGLSELVPLPSMKAEVSPPTELVYSCQPSPRSLEAGAGAAAWSESGTEYSERHQFV